MTRSYLENRSLACRLVTVWQQKLGQRSSWRKTRLRCKHWGTLCKKIFYLKHHTHTLSIKFSFSSISQATHILFSSQCLNHCTLLFSMKTLINISQCCLHNTQIVLLIWDGSMQMLYWSPDIGSYYLGQSLFNFATSHWQNCMILERMYFKKLSPLGVRSGIPEVHCTVRIDLMHEMKSRPQGSWMWTRKSEK